MQRLFSCDSPQKPKSTAFESSMNVCHKLAADILTQIPFETITIGRTHQSHICIKYGVDSTRNAFSLGLRDDRPTTVIPVRYIGIGSGLQTQTGQVAASYTSSDRSHVQQEHLSLRV